MLERFLQDAPLIPLVVVLPLLAAAFTAMIRQPSAQKFVAGMFSVAQIFVVFSLYNLWRDGEIVFPIRYTLAGWGAPLGIDLQLNGSSLAMLITTNVIGFVATFYSVKYFKKAEQAVVFWPLWWLLFAGINAVFIAADAFNIYVALEIIGLASVALVAITRSREAFLAALRYAFVGLIGSLLYLLGVVILYRYYGSLDLQELSSSIQLSAASSFALMLISVGLLLKTALFPLHFWLPHAHANAPAPVSAVLSALVVKASFFLLVRYWLEILSPAVNEFAMNMLGALGAGAIILGCIGAYRAERLKTLVAYSTIAQLGYLFMLFPLIAGSGEQRANIEAAVTSVFFLVVAHAFAKAAMFLTAGNILKTEGHDVIQNLEGLAYRQPWTVFIFAAAGVSLIGLPPSGGFIAKWLLLNASIQNGQWWWAALMLMGGLFAATYIFKVLNIMFKVNNSFTQDGATKSDVEKYREKNKTMTLAAASLALVAILLGFNAQWLITLLSSGLNINVMALQ